MPRQIYSWLLAVSLACTSLASAEGVGDLLNQHYAKQVLALRNPVIEGEESFDSSGRPLTTPSANEWTVSGGIYVQRIRLSPDRLLLEGPPVVFVGRDKRDKVMIEALGKPVKLHVHLDQPLTTLNQVQAVLGRIFLLGEDPLLHKVEFRRADYGNSSDQSLFRIGQNGTKAPVPIDTPSPSFSVQARQGKYNVTVLLVVTVDARGTISRIRVERAVGRGLDEQAIDAVKTWRFKPATRNGQPVPIKMSVEVAFNLS